jgi:hypothetical protein
MLHPNGKDTVGFHGTPYDNRALTNARGDFRRLGSPFDKQDTMGL